MEQYLNNVFFTFIFLQERRDDEKNEIKNKIKK